MKLCKFFRAVLRNPHSPRELVNKRKIIIFSHFMSPFNVYKRARETSSEAFPTIKINSGRRRSFVRISKMPECGSKCECRKLKYQLLNLPLLKCVRKKKSTATNGHFCSTRANLSSSVTVQRHVVRGKEKKERYCDMMEA